MSMNQITATHYLRQQEEQEQQKWVATQLIALNLPPLHQQMIMVTTSGLSNTGEKNLYHPKFKVDDMVLAELWIWKFPSTVNKFQQNISSATVVALLLLLNLPSTSQAITNTSIATTTTTTTLPICRQDVCHLQILFGHQVIQSHRLTSCMRQEELGFSCSIIPTFSVTRKHWRIWSHLLHH